MKAVVVHGAKDFEVKNVEEPSCPERGILLKVISCSLCGSDRRTLESGHPKIDFPIVIGHELSGTVVEVGSEYRGPWEEGDVLAVGPIVYCGHCEFCKENDYELCDNIRELAKHWPGGFAEYMAVPEESLHLGPIERVPENLDPQLAGIAEPIACCVNAQEYGSVGFDDTVVVLGDGPVGNIHVALAKAKGAKRVIMSGKYDFKLNKARELGADDIVYHNKTDVVEAVRELTDGLGADVVITANSSPQAQIDGVEMARKGGRILLFGGLPKDQNRPGIDTNDVHYGGKKVIGTTVFAPRHYRKAISLMSEGRIPADTLVTHRLPLEEFEKGLELADRGEALKISYLPGDGSDRAQAVS